MNNKPSLSFCRYALRRRAYLQNRMTRMKIGIIACGAIVREMIAIARRQHWDYQLTAVPAQLHNRPERIAPAVERALNEWADQFDLILIGYGDCGTGGALD